MKKNLLLIWILLSLWGAQLPLMAQWKVSLSNFSVRDENIFNNYQKSSDTYFVPALNISRMTRRLEGYYSAQTIRLLENTIFNNQTHTAGLELYLPFSDDLLTYWGVNVKARFNEPDYNYFNYYQGRLYCWGKGYPSDNQLTRFGFSLQAKQFTEEPSWNHLEFSGMLQHNLFFQTGTTLRLGAEGLFRDFAEYQGYTDSTYFTDELPTLWQAVFTIRLAQSISKKTGGYTEFRYRYNPSETNPYSPVIETFSPIDDYFGYGGWNWFSSLKYKFSEKGWLQATGDLYRKDYKNRPIYEYDFAAAAFTLDEDGYYIATGDSRSDSGYEINIEIQYRFDQIFKTTAQLTAGLAYSFRSNNSNDAYFDYRDNMISLNLKYFFQF